MIAPVSDTMRTRARRLRTDQTDAEARLWNALRAKRLDGLKVRRQLPIGPYIVDFYCSTHKLVIELDGSQHGNDDAVAYNRYRTAWLEREGYRVVRFWNGDVMNDLDNVCRQILLLCRQDRMEVQNA